MKRVIRIRRGVGQAARIGNFEVECDQRTTLLDALESIRTGNGVKTAVHDLAYRHSCHHGSCGTCSVRVDGRELLACLTLLDSLPGDAPLVEPLAVFDAVVDVAVDMGRLFRSMPEGSTYLRASEPEPSADGTPAAPPVDLDADIRRFTRFEDCIECGCCVSACPVPAESFRGPAALAAIRRESINAPERAEAMLIEAAQPDGVARCERNLACSRVCPRAVYPAKHIELLRRSIAASAGKD